MTQPKPLPEIARCADSKTRGILLQHGSRFYVASKGLAGWRGPDKRTARAAILAWNRVMGAVKYRETLCDRAKSIVLRCVSHGGDARTAIEELDKIRRVE